MSVSDNYTPTKNQGNGVTTEYTASWPVFNADYLVVTFEDVVTGVQTVQSSGFTVTFTESTVTATFSTAPPNTVFVILSRSIPLAQQTPYSTSRGFQGKSVETSLDLLTAMVQDVEDDTIRAITAPVGTTLASNVVTPEGEKILGWNAAADQIINYDQSDFTGPAGPAGPAGSIDNIADQPTGTPATGDFLVWADVDDSDNSKKSTIGDTIRTSGVINGATDTTITATDEILFGDVSDSNDIKKDTVQGILDLVPASGMGVLLGSYTASNDTSVDIGSGLDLDAAIDSTYDEYVLVGVSVVAASDGNSVYIRTSTDGGTTFQAGTNYAYAGTDVSSGTTIDDVAGTGTAQAQLNSSSMGFATNEFCDFTIRIMNPSNTSLPTTFMASMNYYTTANTFRNVNMGFANLNAADVDAIRVLMASGNITSGKFYLYGISKS